ncbi:acyl transferase domain-containing protein [Ruminiclostridium sufflavum DSM 19573]|uniref:Acyl transferase domain-containing protein n=1 Tax=Ruminiclostridium sufflavum DSM 19573 TaxID=1121337 RepID=A0A318XJD9_9FIRM|nr:SDR family NAD(P)-dependent oxidoreductase [Ruminiclostridium sufflavum]PYG84959.1 acyl transferase domain-containing protein [Ruminiclostridium sufflavum DSM 19573]
MKYQLHVERYSTNDDEMEVVNWYVQDHDYVKKGDIIVDLESAKAVVSVESNYEGYITRMCQVGDTVAVDSVFAEIETQEISVDQNSKVVPVIEEKVSTKIVFSKGAQNYIDEHHIDIGQYNLSGLVTKEDVIKQVTGQINMQGEIVTTKPVEDSVKMVNQEMMSVINKNPEEKVMERCQVINISNAKKHEIAYLQEGQEGGINSSLTVEFFSQPIRKKLSELGLTSNQLLPLIIFELAKVLKKYPKLNACFKSNQIMLYDDINIGIAIDMEHGLKVPVIKKADTYQLDGIFDKVLNYINKYINNKLSIEDLSEGTFTVTDLSNERVLNFQPLINKGQAAILGMGGDSEKAGYPITLTLVFDHRILSGKEVSEALNELKDAVCSYTQATFSDKMDEIACSNNCGQEEIANSFTTDIAIVGMSGRFPGAENIEQFWDNLKEGRSGIKTLTDEELRAAGVSDEVINNSNYVKACAPLKDMDCFDSGFFKYTPKEAEMMDPQQRLLLECAWQALEDAGYAPDQIKAITGVYFSVFWNLYSAQDNWMAQKMPSMKPAEKFLAMVCNDKDYIATRVSYKLNLKGPSLCVQTACSSGLVGIHLAAQSLIAGECEMALAGGCSVIMPQEEGYFYQKNLIFSPDGKCKAFDEGADGTIFGNGVGIVVLKRLNDAIRDHDNIYAVIKGTAINNDGSAKTDFTAPSVDGQSDVIKKALDFSGINPRTIQYVETHGTGTKIGDPLEIEALTEAYRAYTNDVNYCGIGSVKTNIGHLNSISGIPSIIKVALSLKNHVMIPIINFTKPNPMIPFSETPFYVNTELKNWDADQAPRRAGVSSFGIGGTNAHMILEEAPIYEYEADKEPYFIFLLSAKTKDALRRMTYSFMEWLGINGNEYRLSDISYTLATGRSNFNIRLAIVANSVETLIEQLQLAIDDQASDYLLMNKLQVNKCINEPCLEELGESIIEKLTTNQSLDSEQYFKKVRALGDLFVKGYIVDWKALFAFKPQFKVPLPTYSFDKERYWMPDKVKRLTNRQGSVLNEMIDYNTSTLGEVSFSKKLDANMFYLRDHVVLERNILPGVAYIEMAREAGNQAKRTETVTRIDNIVWIQPIDTTNQTKNISVIIEAIHQDVKFKVVDTDNHQIVHAKGQLAYVTDGISNKIENIAEIKKRMSHVIDPNTFYTKVAEWGIAYGSTFRGIKQIFVGKDEAFSEIQLSEEVKQYQNLVLQPSLLDCAIQTIIGIYQNDKEQRVLLPMSLKSIRWCKNIPQGSYYAHVKAIDAVSDTMGKFDLNIYDSTGKLVIEMKELVARAVDDMKAAAIGYFKMDWQEENFDLRQAASSEAILFAGSPATLDELIKTQLVDESQIIDLTNYSYDLLKERIKGEKVNIAYTLGAAPDDLEQLNDTLECDSNYLLDLTKGLTQLGIKQIKLIVLDYLQTDLSQVRINAIASFLKSAQLENVSLIGKTIGCQKPLNEAILLTKQEFLDNSNNFKEVQYQEDKRLVKHILETDMLSSKGNTIFKQGGHYFITGGTGKLALIFAEYLMQKYSAKITLIGRSALNDEKAVLLEKLVGNVNYIQADVNDYTTLVNSLAQAKAINGDINGIIHTAGLIMDAFIWDKDFETFKEVIAPKVKGTVNLHRATENESMDCFIMFSSLGSVVGNAGQSDYTFANGFMDAFAVYRNSLVQLGKCKGKTISINWPIWEQGAMKPPAKILERITSKTGMTLLKTQDGTKALEKILMNEWSHILVIAGDLARFNAFIHNSTNPVNKKSELVVTKVKKSKKAEGIERIDDFLSMEISKLLEIDASTLDLSQNLEDYGADSILLMDLIDSINSKYGMDMMPSELFEFKSIEQIAEHIRSTIGETSQSLAIEEAAYTTNITQTTQTDIQSFILEELANLLGIDEEKIDIALDLEEYGADSILLMDLIDSINSKYGMDMMPSELFEYKSVEQIAEHIKSTIGETSPNLAIEEAAFTTYHTQATIQSFILEELTNLLGIDKDKIDVTLDLEEYGADSILLMDLIDSINAKYGMDMMPSELFEYKTVEKITGFILDKVGNNGTISDVKALVEEQSIEAESGKEAVITSNYAFMDKTVYTEDGTLIGYKNFNLKSDPMFFDHIVLGLPRMQAVGYIELINETVKNSKAFDINKIQNLSMYYPISILEEMDNETEVKIKKSDYETYEVEIKSLFNNKYYLNTKAKGSCVVLENKKLDIKKLLSEITIPKEDRGNFNDVNEGYTNNYVGEYFYAYKDVFLSEDRMFAHIDLSNKAKQMNNNFLLHPGLLDPCVYLAMEIAHRRFDNMGEVVYLPIFFREILIYGDVNKESYCLVENTDEQNEDKSVQNYNLTFSDMEGNVLLEILGLELKKVKEDKKGKTQEIIDHMEEQKQPHFSLDTIKNRKGEK